MLGAFREQGWRQNFFACISLAIRSLLLAFFSPLFCCCLPFDRPLCEKAMSQDSSAPAAVSKLKCEHSLAIHSFTLSLIDECASEIRKIPDFGSKRLDSQLTVAALKMVRDAIISAAGKHLTHKQASSLDRRELTCAAIAKAFGLSDEECALISNQIDFVMENKVVSKHLFAKAARTVTSLFK
jgi:hypothetical protein